MQVRKDSVVSGLRRQAPPLAMLLAASMLHLGSLSRAVFDDDAVVEFHLAAMMDAGESARVCPAPHPVAVATDGWCAAPTTREPAAAFPFVLVYRDPFAPSTPAPWSEGGDFEQIAVAAAALPAAAIAPAAAVAVVAEKPTHLPFDPLEEPAFVRATDPFVLVRDESGKEIARGWLPAQRTNLVWQTPSPAVARVPIGPPLLEEHLDRLTALRADPDVLELERHAKGGETLTKLLDDARLERRDLSVWLDAIDGLAALDRLARNQRVSLLIAKHDRTLRQLSVDLSEESMLVALRRGAIIVADRVPIPRMKRMRAVGGEIKTSLAASAAADDVPEKTVAEMAEILGWEVDFSTLRRGSSYRAVYEETVRLDTGERTAGRVLAVEIVNGDRTHEAYYFAAKGGDDGAYYDRDGQSLDGMFLRYPVAYTRISSFFSDSRFHPIKNRHLPHYGVDFAAPTGTPVVAVADGTVSKAGWLGGNGRMVKIRHDGTYESGYAHLSRIASGVTSGTRVRQGQVIGYVGSSGLATGPHLHFAMFRQGKYVDPLKVNTGRRPALAGGSRAAFQLALGSVDDALDRAGLSRDAVVQVSMVTTGSDRSSSR
jgi:murein DD-endopeptidase MepM/ murein hydrolase activator NlpD